MIPVYNEQENVEFAYNSIKDIMISISDKYDYEFIFSDNHSDDKTFSLLKKIAKDNDKVKVIRLSKNYGYQRSILNGYNHSKGDIAIQFDCDLQDPPILIHKFLEFWEKGYDIVYGIRKTRKENIFIHASRKLFYRIIDILSEDILPKDAGDFRLIDRKILNILKNIDDHQPYLRGTIASLGFKQIGINYNRDLRLRGYSKFKFKDLFGLAIDGILNHSIIPLRIASVFGFVISILSIISIIIYFIGKLVYGPLWNAGFATTTIFLLISIGLNSLFLGILGEYIGRIYKQVKSKPALHIEDKVNI